MVVTRVRIYASELRKRRVFAAAVHTDMFNPLNDRRFYALVEKLADALRYSKPYIHNLMLRKYGQFQQIDGKPVWVVLPESEEVAKRVDEDETLHVRPTDEVKQGKDGKMYRTYLLLKGSHELNSKEFSILLDGIISDCHEANIQTATPQEIQMMKERWGIEIDGAKD